MKGCALVSGVQTLSELVLYTIRDLLRVFGKSIRGAPQQWDWDCGLVVTSAKQDVGKKTKKSVLK